MEVKYSPAQTSPRITISGDTNFCLGASVTLTSDSASSYLWSNGATSRNVGITSSGTYSVINFNDFGFQSPPSRTVQMVVSDVKKPVIKLSDVTNLCGGASVTLTAPLPNKYIKSNGDTSQSITTDTVGTYTVKVVVNTCTSLASVSIVVTMNKALTIITNRSPNLCKGDSVRLFAPP